MPAPRIIGLNGKKGSGKDTAGAYLVAAHGYERLSFAAPLKVSAAASLGLPPDPETFEEWKNNPEARVQLLIYPAATTRDEDDAEVVVDISVREYLQYYGTEGHRDVFGADFWTRQLIEALDPEKRYVITDSRFVNECGAVRDAGGVIVVIQRDSAESADTHASEESLPDELVDTVLYNNGSIEDLYKTLDAYMLIANALTDGGIESLELP
jgi:hypothetical protein